MKRFACALLLVVAVFASSFAQTPQTQASQADEIVRNIRRLDLLRHLMPLVLTKVQANELLTEIEKIRAEAKKIEATEFAELKKREERISGQIKEALDSGKFPDRTAIIELNRVLIAFGTVRRNQAEKNVDQIMAFAARRLNDGQRKVMVNAIDFREVDPTLKEAPEDRVRMRYFIAEVLLDPLAYDLLVQLAKKAS